MKLTLLALSILSAQIAFAQYFIPPMNSDEVLLSPMAIVITTEGDSITGKVIAGTLINGQLRNFTFRDTQNQRIKYKAEQVKALLVKPSKISNVSSALSVPNLSKALKMDFDEVIKREWVYFDQALLPKKKDKYALMQLLNYGFDSKLKVYQDPMAMQTMGLSAGGMQLVGGEDRRYLVVIDGQKSEVFKKTNYNKYALTELFKDCEVFAENYEGKRFRWADFAEHVFVYDQLCE